MEKWLYHTESLPVTSTSKRTGRLSGMVSETLKANPSGMTLTWPGPIVS